MIEPNILLTYNLLTNIINHKNWNVEIKNSSFSKTCVARVWNGNGQRCKNKSVYLEFCGIHNSFKVNGKYVINGIVHGRRYKKKEIKYFIKQVWEKNGRVDEPFIAKNKNGDILWKGDVPFFFEEKINTINKSKKKKLFEFMNIKKKEKTNVGTKQINKFPKSVKSKLIENLIDEKYKLSKKNIKTKNSLKLWWSNSHKIVIIDVNTKARFQVALEKINGKKGFNLYQKNKQCVGKALPWIDKDNLIPEEFKHKNIVQEPNMFGLPLYIYKLNTNSQIYHDLPKKTYWKYRYDSNNQFLKITNEIMEQF